MTVSIEQRLARLPQKASLPFRHLLTSGHISEDALQSVLDAGEITGETTRLIGFAVAFLHLRGQGIPVHDVIRMAKSQNRRVNLGWAPSGGRRSMTGSRVPRPCSGCEPACKFDPCGGVIGAQF